MRLMATTGRPPAPELPKDIHALRGLRQQQVQDDDVGKQLQVEAPGAPRRPGLADHGQVR
jgi:hypothetical protein